MMEEKRTAQEVILKRRSIRNYTAEPVTEEQIRALLEAGMSAPSAGNQRPWHFVVITDRAIREEIPRLHPYASMVPRAPVVIAVCADPALERYPGYWPQDCAAATENILLSAEAQGLGAVWLGVHPDEDRMHKLGAL
ncbi:nitroreductase family protein, partial [Aminiphilus sp.]|uniref:nitroreductase family protein n=1 Tax=Aminiphilus sp. TaxID=1872488 RepID=UPI0026252855